MKRTKQVQAIVDEVNVYLRENIADEYDVVFEVITDALIKAGAYDGFNYYDTETNRLTTKRPSAYIQLY